jgi:hypothetical protein
MTKYGRYIVATGKELQVRPTHKHYHDYIVTDESRNFLAAYVSEFYAINAAKGFDKRDHAQLSEAIENILVGSQDEN